MNKLQRTLLRGTHPWQDEAEDQEWYIASMDVAGEELPTPTTSLMTHKSKPSASTRRDSTVMTIGHVRYNELNLPVIDVVHHEWWTGLPHMQQYTMTLALMERWHVRTLVIDGTGLGAGLASLLRSALGDDRVISFVFSRSSKSYLAYQLLALLNSGRLKLYSPDRAPHYIFDECWLQLCNARYSLPAPNTLNFYVDPADGHDDFLSSLALLPEALHSITAPAASTVVRPAKLYAGEGYF